MGIEIGSCSLPSESGKWSYRRVSSHWSFVNGDLTGDPAREVLKDACQDLMLMCQHIRTTFDSAVADFKKDPGGGETTQHMNLD